MSELNPTPSTQGDHLDRLYLAADAEIPWYKSLYENIHEFISPPKLPPLVVTSQPVAVKSIWGMYERDKKSNWASLAIHVAVVTLLLTVLSQHDKIEKKMKDL